MPRDAKLKVKIDSAISTVSIARRNKKSGKENIIKKRKPRCELINKRLLKEAISKEKPRLLSQSARSTEWSCEQKSSKSSDFNETGGQRVISHL